jgi:hypothetical protein
MNRQSLPFAILLAVLLGGCAAYDGYNLHPGSSRLEEIERVMGEPAMRWPEADGGETLAFPRGPGGYHTFMLRTDAAGVLLRRENALEPQNFARIQAGLSQAEVLRVLGPPTPAWTTYFAARDELIWEWRYCDDWNEPARFDVLFDGTSLLVRSAMAMPERQRNILGAGGRREWCSR